MRSKVYTFIHTYNATHDNGNEYTVSVRPGDLVKSAKFVHRELRGVVSAVFCLEEQKGYTLVVVFSIRSSGLFIILRCHSDTPRFPAISPAMHAADWFEREIQDLFGVAMEGHLDPRPLMLFPENWPPDQHPLRKDYPAGLRPEAQAGEFAYQRVEGEGVYEIPVGPVHAGVIEPGHFRFSVAGEPVIGLEPRLFWKHKGIEKQFEGKDPLAMVALAERISGDESFSHAFAYIHAIERICGVSVPLRAEYLRGLAAELERASLHLFDIGNICVGTAFYMGSAGLWRLKEALMRECDRLFGSRFLRGVLCPGGVSKDISRSDLASLNAFLARALAEADSLIKIIFSSSSITDRLRTTAPLRREVALDFGTVGVVARGSGIGFDARFHIPYSVYRIHRPNVVVETDGDVQARIMVRVGELRESIRYIGRLIAAIPDGPVAVPMSEVDDGCALGWAEAPRGMALFFVEIREGKLSRVKITSPSFLNWHAMPQAISGMIIPDFPLLNKSFGLSYSGCDG